MDIIGFIELQENNDYASKINNLDHSCNKCCDLIGQEEVSISHKTS